jgi:ABC-type transporter Mla subunit MlaD
MPPGLPKHPIGTFAFVVLYAVLFVIGWFAVYWFIYLARQPVTP